MILDKFPSAAEFYKEFWGKKPFVVRGAIDPCVFDDLIDGGSLAALSMEEEVKSRIVITQEGEKKWLCEHGPFEEERFAPLGDNNWSLLVQNVEQYHTDTAKLLQSFHFSPRWLMDDIMVSYSADGGSVGPHTDSYHVFLVQGMGKRSWTVGHEPIMQEDLIEGLDLKVLKDGVDGQTFEVTMGDVIYIPPHFAHEGKTIEEALTYSVGFLGPKMSEMLIEYGHYLEQNETSDERYSGADLNEQSSAFMIAQEAQDTIQGDLVGAIKADGFSKWLASYFSTPTYADVENIAQRDVPLTDQELLDALRDGDVLYKPDHIKIVVTPSKDGAIHLSAYGSVITMALPEPLGLIEILNQNKTVSAEDIKLLDASDEIMSVLTHLYNQNILFFDGEDLTVS
jgi:50S ribosomal protein L16 3-hydroxylase